MQGITLKALFEQSAGLPNRRRFLQVTGAAVGGLVAARSSAARPKTPLEVWLGSPPFEDSVTHTMATAHVPAADIAVVEDGRIILSKGFGLADIAAKRRMTSSTVIKIASVTQDDHLHGNQYVFRPL
jgi:CubicO group peptidase (beta-lactamase class C family)